MQTSSQPKLLPIPFADAGSKQAIPNDSQIGITAGRASYTDGFPPLTRTPLAAGGVPPFGTDFNGVLNDITAAVRWSQAGAGYPFDSSFNTAIAGYPKGARIPNSTLDGFWLNTVEGNSNNPENTNASLTGWVPSDNYGSTAVTGLSGSSVTLTALQAAKARITLSGTLTASINIILPAWKKSWIISNGTSGSFNITVKTPSGSGVSIASGQTVTVIGDGTNITVDNINSRQQIFTTSSSFTVPAGVTTLYVSGCAAGGGSGAGAGSTSSFVGGGGGGGGAGQSIIKQSVTVTPGQVINITIGNAGTAGVRSATAGNSGGNGGNGGNTLFGSLFTLIGGGGGVGGVSAASGGAGGGAAGSGYPYGSDGQDSTTNNASADGGSGASSPFGGGGGKGKSGKSSGNGGYAAYGYGSGGGGGAGVYTLVSGLGGAGSAGAPGLIIVEW